MKKEFIIFFVILTIIIILIATFIIQKHQANNNKIGENMNTTIPLNITNSEEKTVKRTLDKVKMSIKEGTVSATGATIIIEDDNEQPYNYTTWYRIDKEVNGQWIALEPIDDNNISDELSLYQNFEFQIDWSNIYGTLEKGQYRLVKTIFDNENQYFWVEFSIN